MNRLIRFIPLIVSCMVIQFVPVLAHDLIYIHPSPNSRLASPHTTLILRFQEKLSSDQLQDIHFEVIGNISGKKSGDMVHASDHRTLIFKPHIEFELGERISVSIESSTLADTSFSFNIAPEWLIHTSLIRPSSSITRDYNREYRLPVL